MFIIHNGLKKMRFFCSVAIDPALENVNGKEHHKPRETENDVTLLGKREIPHRTTQTLKLSLTRMFVNK
jgi:hypothetical protein